MENKLALFEEKEIRKTWQGWVQIVHTLKMQTKGGMQKINCADTEGILRIIQSIPSPKAEPFKRWLAKVGNVLNKTRSEIENELGKSIVTSQNYIELTDTLIETK